MKIAIDCGHTLRGYDTGAEGNGRREQDLTREVGNLVMSKLQALGHEVVNCTIDSCGSLNESLSHRVNVANNSNADLFCCIHFNCGGGHGTEVFTYQGRELSQARNVLNNICALGFTNRGIKSASLYVINHTNMPSMLVECCFIDSQSDMSKYNANNFADAIVKGLVGQTTNVSIPQNNPQPQNNNGYSATVRDFQRQWNETYGNVYGNIDVDGYWGNQTENAINHTLVKYGDRNSLVGFIQCRVGAGIDYCWGNETQQKVIAWQNANGLEADAIFGRNSMRKMLEIFR